jgi:hypothetical protein
MALAYLPAVEAARVKSNRLGRFPCGNFRAGWTGSGLFVGSIGEVELVENGDTDLRRDPMIDRCGDTIDGQFHFLWEKVLSNFSCCRNPS